jgi:hypothetical protein
VGIRPDAVNAAGRNPAAESDAIMEKPPPSFESDGFLEWIGPEVPVSASRGHWTFSGA